MIERQQGFDRKSERTRTKHEVIKSRDNRRSGLYFVAAAGANLVKIGWVQRLDKIDVRLQRMQTDCPYPVVLLFAMGPATREHEWRVHKRFETQRWHGEWFKVEGPLDDFLHIAAQDADDAKAKLRKMMNLTF